MKLVILVFVIFAAGCVRPVEKHTELVEEFSRIQILEGSKLISRSSSYEIGQAIYGGTFNNNESFSTINEHYISQLEQNGWVFETRTKMYYWNEDLGGECVTFLKGDKVAVLEYAGEKADFGWNYAFIITWGLTGC